MDFNKVLNIVEQHDWFEYFEVVEQETKSRLRPRSWVVYIYRTLPFYIAANLSGKELVDILYEKARQQHAGLSYEDVEECISTLFMGKEMFSEILHWFLQGGRAEFQKNVYLESLENFYKYGWRLGACIQQKDEIERFLIHNAESAGNA
jgi:hypothetical protein